MAGDALEPDSPDRLDAAVIAADVLVPDILVHLIRYLEEVRLVLVLDALVA